MQAVAREFKLTAVRDPIGREDSALTEQDMEATAAALRRANLSPRDIEIIARGISGFLEGFSDGEQAVPLAVLRGAVHDQLAVSPFEEH